MSKWFICTIQNCSHWVVVFILHQHKSDSTCSRDALAFFSRGKTKKHATNKMLNDSHHSCGQTWTDQWQGWSFHCLQLLWWVSHWWHDWMESQSRHSCRQQHNTLKVQWCCQWQFWQRISFVWKEKAELHPHISGDNNLHVQIGDEQALWRKSHPKLQAFCLTLNRTKSFRHQAWWCVTCKNELKRRTEEKHCANMTSPNTFDSWVSSCLQSAQKSSFS